MDARKASGHCSVFAVTRSSTSKRVKLWNAMEKSVVWTSPQAHDVTCAAYSATSNRLVHDFRPYEDKGVMCWDLSLGQLVRSMVLDRANSFKSIKINSAGTKCITGSSVGIRAAAINVLDLESGTILKSFKGEVEANFTTVGEREDHVVLLTRAGILELWDPVCTSPLLQIHRFSHGSIWGTISMGTQLPLCAVHCSRTIGVWNYESGQQLALTSLLKSLPAVRDLCIGPTDDSLLAIFEDGSLKSWDISSMQLLFEYRSEFPQLRAIPSRFDEGSLFVLAATNIRTSHVREIDAHTGAEKSRGQDYNATCVMGIFSCPRLTILM
jgi:WD40 repeat protein